LPQQPRSAGAERRAHGDFVGACRGAREQQIRDVGAGDDENQRDGGEQQVERGSRVADELILQRSDGGALLIVRRRIRGFEAGGDRRHFRLSLFERDAFLQSADDAIVVRRPRRGFGLHPCRKPDVGLAGAAKAGRHHANDRERPLAEADGAANGAGVTAEPPHPELVANDRSQRTAGRFVRRLEDAASLRRDAKDGEESGRDPNGGRVVARPTDRHAGFAACVVGHGVERRCAVVPVVKVGRRDTAAHARVAPMRRDRHDPLGMRVGQRSQQHRIDHGEDGGVGADAERQGSHGHNGERRLPPQRTPGVAEVL
jgi:hypothetical protein